MNTLVVFQETEWRDLVSFYMEGHFGLTPVGVPNEDEAILALIEPGAKFQSVICGPFLNSERILWCILAENHRLELILNSDPDLKRNFPFRGKDWIHFVPGFDLISSLEMLMLETPDSLEKKNNRSSWTRIKPRLLLYSSPVPGEVRVLRNHGQTHERTHGLESGTPVPWISPGGQIQDEELSRLAGDPSVEGFYVQREKCTDFALKIQETLLKRQEEAKLKLPDVDLPEGVLKEKRLDYLKKRLQFLEQDHQKLQNFGHGNEEKNS